MSAWNDVASCCSSCDSLKETKMAAGWAALAELQPTKRKLNVRFVLLDSERCVWKRGVQVFFEETLDEFLFTPPQTDFTATGSQETLMKRTNGRPHVL